VLDERERREHVRGVDALQLGDRISSERRLRARAEQARVVHERIDALAGGLDERSPVMVVPHVARKRSDLGDLTELAGDAMEVLGAARVEHERPVVGGELACQGQAEAARRAGDDC
jgi:hypothetical protein